MSSVFWKWTSQVRPHWRESKVEAAVLFTVFGITGSSTMFLVRPALKTFGIEGSMIDGPNSYRVISFLTITPIYITILTTLGTISGRHRFFANQATKMLSRFGLSREKVIKTCCPAKK
jgi:hypothetical protein